MPELRPYFRKCAATLLAVLLCSSSTWLHAQGVVKWNVERGYMDSILHQSGIWLSRNLEVTPSATEVKFTVICDFSFMIQTPDERLKTTKWGQSTPAVASNSGRERMREALRGQVLSSGFRPRQSFLSDQVKKITQTCKGLKQLIAALAAGQTIRGRCFGADP